MKKILKNKLVQIIIKLAIGTLLITTATATYLPMLNNIHDLTFLSNFFVGILFVFSAILQIFNKQISSIIALNATTLLGLVLLFSLIFINTINFDDLFIYLHLINPIIVISYWLIFENSAPIKNKKMVLTVISTPIIYYVYIVINSIITGDYFYPPFDPLTNGYGYVIMLVLGLSIAVILIGYALLYLNLFFNKNNEK